MLACCTSHLLKCPRVVDCPTTNFDFGFWRLTAVASAVTVVGREVGVVAVFSSVGVEVLLSLGGELDGVLVLVLGRHFDSLCGWVGIWMCLKDELMEIECDEERKTELARLEEVFLLLQSIEHCIIEGWVFMTFVCQDVFCRWKRPSRSSP